MGNFQDLFRLQKNIWISSCWKVGSCLFAEICLMVWVASKISMNLACIKWDLSSLTTSTIDLSEVDAWTIEWKWGMMCSAYTQCERTNKMDNCSTHQSQEFIGLIIGTGAIILYLPPYSPHLNVAELVHAPPVDSGRPHFTRADGAW